MRDIFSQLSKYLRPSNLFKGFGFVLSEWYRSDAKERAVLFLIFTPMIICMLGLLYSFASFVFEAISRLLGWFLLSVIFGGGGIFFYEKLRDSRTSSASTFSSTRQATSTAYDATTTAENSEKSTRQAKEENAAKPNGKRTYF